jgi:hygromycin-B 4-O-kinase
MALTLEQVVVALARVGYGADGITAVGAGAWSTCYGFRADNRDLVVRFGLYAEDFAKDRYAERFSTPAMPVPRVEAIERCEGGYLAVSTRVPGTPLEGMSGDEWIELIPGVVDVLEALRQSDVAHGKFGGWDGAGVAHSERWSDHLVAVRCGTDERGPVDVYGLLADHAAALAAFDDGYQRLAELDLSAAPRSLIHADLINRNVHVDEGRIAGVFDWGCGRYGDHLYDASCFEFWAPYHPQLDIEQLLTRLHQRWVAADADLTGFEQRRRACLLHIGLDHIAYNAGRGAWADVDAVVSRMAELDLV